MLSHQLHLLWISWITLDWASMLPSPGWMRRHLTVAASVNGLTPVCRFFTFMLLMFLLHSMGLGLFRFVASLCRSETVASSGGSFFLVVLLLLGGFLLPRRAVLLVAGLVLREHSNQARTCTPTTANDWDSRTGCARRER